MDLQFNAWSDCGVGSPATWAHLNAYRATQGFASLAPSGQIESRDVRDLKPYVASADSTAHFGGLWLLKSPFLLRQLMLQPTMDTLGR